MEGWAFHHNLTIPFSSGSSPDSLLENNNGFLLVRPMNFRVDRCSLFMMQCRHVSLGSLGRGSSDLISYSFSKKCFARDCFCAQLNFNHLHPAQYGEIPIRFPAVASKNF